jgi:hypothetical protein
MDLSEDEVRRAAEIKQWAESRIEELQGEVERLRGILSVLDVVLRQTSFQSAAGIPKDTSPIEAPPSSKAKATSTEYKEIRPLTRPKDGRILANAYISDASVAIVPSSDIVLSSSTPPFKSFLLNRILDGMRDKDIENVSARMLSEDEALSYAVEEEDETIKKIVVNNYRDQGRLNEIFSTSVWTFSRMLEKK